MKERRLGKTIAEGVLIFILAYIMVSLLINNKVIYGNINIRNMPFLIIVVLLSVVFFSGKKLIQKKECIMKTSRSILQVFEPQKVDLWYIFCGTLVFSFTFWYTSKLPLDYPAHLVLAESFDFANLIESIKYNSYPLWHVICVLFEKIFYIPGKYAASLTSSLLVYFTYYISRQIMLTSVKSDEGYKIASVFSAMLMFVQPIFIPWFNETQQTGQGSPNIINNPTNLAAKPFAIICIWLFINICSKHKEGKDNIIDYIQLALFCFISVLAKPSFAQVCIPAVGLYLIYLFFRTKGKDLAFCLKNAIVWIPAVSWMGLTFYLNFISATTSKGNGVALSFFNVWKVYSPCIPLSVLLVTLFPICVLFFSKYIENGEQKLGLIMGTMMVVVGIMEYGLLMETGDRMLHGNFSWGYNIGLGVMWTFATSILVSKIEDHKIEEDKKWRLGCVLFLIHFVFGIYYYCSTM